MYDESLIEGTVVKFRTRIDTTGVSDSTRNRVCEYYEGVLGRSREDVLLGVDLYLIEHIVVGNDGICNYRVMSYVTYMDHEEGSFEELNVVTLGEFSEYVKNTFELNVGGFEFLGYVNN